MRDDSAYSLNDKVALVTGSGSGIGRGIAVEMANAGAHVVLAELEHESAEATAAMVQDMGRRALVVETDVTDPESVERMMGATLKEFGSADILVNNVGGVGPEPKKTALADMSLDQWDSMLRLNLTSQFLCCKAFVNYLLANGRGGSIVNIASLAAMVPYETNVAYGAAKAGVVSMTKTIASEYGP
ncbi:MAG: SDR family NAD(P)-dependent oxidoreductase, partial [Chloroflexota bacterium]